MARRFQVPVLSLAVVVAAAACHHPPPAVTTGPVAANADSARLAQMRADSIARADAARRDSIARAMALDSARRAEEARRLAEEDARKTIIAPIHFEFDRAELQADDRPLLDRKATLLTTERGVQLRIEGNTDERGSDEYNLALGMRRAAAARRFLIQHGIDSTRLTITSNGEEHPLCQEHDESCWSQNRRDEFVITGGWKQIARRP